MARNNSSNAKKDKESKKPEVQSESRQTKEETQQKASITTKKNQLTVADWINVVIAFLTFLSVIGVFVTVNEMRTDRKAAYSPSIVMQPITVDVSWDTKGFESWLNTDEDMVTILPSKGDFSEGKIHIQYQAVRGSLNKNYEVLNIGVAAAKNITFKWATNNTEVLFDYLVKIDPSKSKFCETNEENASFFYEYGEETHCIVAKKNEDSQLMYMLPTTDTDDKYSIIFPASYSILLNEIMKNANYNHSAENGPFLFLTISGDDIQNNPFSDVIMFKFKLVKFEEEKDGSGNLSYQIIPTLSE